MTDDKAQPTDPVDDPKPLDEPIDAEFREAPTVQAVKRGPGWGASLFMMLLATGAGGVLGYVGAERIPGLLGGGAETDLPANLVTDADLEDARQRQQSALDTATEEVEALTRRLTEVERGLETLQARGDDDISERVAAVTARLDAIETLPTTDGAPADSAVTRSLASAIARVDRLEARLSDQDAATAAELGAVRAEITSLAATVSGFERGGLGGGNALAEAALALSTIDAAARRGQDFSAAFAVLERARPDSPAVQEIAPIAARGAPTIAQLKSDFADRRRSIVQMLEQDGATGAAGAAGRLFGDLVTVRSPDASADFEALDEAESALARDDLGGAINALSRLDGESGALAAEWIETANARRTLERALDTLRLDLMVEEQMPAGAP
ncbi:MAG: hypothetical protein AAFX86_06355 [Pseudomonadota bacterium]